MPRFMLIAKATKESEAGLMPPLEAFAAMDKYQQELSAAGVLREFAGLKPSSAAARITFANGDVTVIDGPFSETKELIAGFMIIEVASRAEAIAWARRSPPTPGQTGTIEVRPFFEAEDFAHLTPEMHDEDAKLREQLATFKK